MESGPKTSAQLFSDILKLQNEGSLPPVDDWNPCLLYTSPSPRDIGPSRMPSSA